MLKRDSTRVFASFATPHLPLHLPLLLFPFTPLRLSYPCPWCGKCLQPDCKCSAQGQRDLGRAASSRSTLLVPNFLPGAGKDKPTPDHPHPELQGPSTVSCWRVQPASATQAWKHLSNQASFEKEERKGRGEKLEPSSVRAHALLPYKHSDLPDPGKSTEHLIHPF